MSTTSTSTSVSGCEDEDLGVFHAACVGDDDWYSERKKELERVLMRMSAMDSRNSVMGMENDDVCAKTGRLFNIYTPERQKLSSFWDSLSVHKDFKLEIYFIKYLLSVPMTEHKIPAELITKLLTRLQSLTKQETDGAMQVLGSALLCPCFTEEDILITAKMLAEPWSANATVRQSYFDALREFLLLDCPHLRNIFAELSCKCISNPASNNTQATILLWTSILQDERRSTLFQESMPQLIDSLLKRIEIGDEVISSICLRFAVQHAPVSLHSKLEMIMKEKMSNQNNPRYQLIASSILRGMMKTDIGNDLFLSAVKFWIADSGKLWEFTVLHDALSTRGISTVNDTIRVCIEFLEYSWQPGFLERIVSILTDLFKLHPPTSFFLLSSLVQNLGRFSTHSQIISAALCAIMNSADPELQRRLYRDIVPLLYLIQFTFFVHQPQEQHVPDWFWGAVEYAGYDIAEKLFTTAVEQGVAALVDGLLVHCRALNTNMPMLRNNPETYLYRHRYCLPLHLILGRASGPSALPIDQVIQTVKVLLQHGADPNKELNETYGPCFFSNNLELVEVLLNGGMSPQCVHLADTHMGRPAVDLLVRYGANPQDLPLSLLSASVRALMWRQGHTILPQSPLYHWAELKINTVPATWEPEYHRDFPAWFKQIIKAGLICWEHYYLIEEGRDRDAASTTKVTLGSIPLLVMHYIQSFLGPSQFAHLDSQLVVEKGRGRVFKE
ncbi:hypothetical protein Pelo_16194 [Pelomyxa schiedti]|nr:hypothetical protein Pelo_16194 [Pelomyxa schiedti]